MPGYILLTLLEIFDKDHISHACKNNCIFVLFIYLRHILVMNFDYPHSRQGIKMIEPHLELKPTQANLLLRSH